MKKKKSWDKKWYTDEFLNELKQTQYTEMCGSLPITVKYAPDAVSPLGIDPRLLGGPMGKTAKSMRLLPEFIIKRIKIKFNEKMLSSFRAVCDKTSSAVCVRGDIDISDSTVTADDGYEIPIRIYKNKNCSSENGCLYFMHGGAFIAGSMTPYDEAWKVFVEKFNMPVISVEYRLMPENPYPTLYNDCQRVFEYIYDNAEMLGFDKSKIFVCGDSAGGNLAQYISTANKGNGRVRGQILLYASLNPIGIEDEYFNKSIKNFKYEPSQKKLSRCITRQLEMMTDSFDSVFDISEPDIRLNPYSFDASGNPPTLISVGALDYLKIENIAWARKLHDAGVPVKAVVYNGMGHGYLNAIGVFPQAEDVIDEMGDFIKKYS